MARTPVPHAKAIRDLLADLVGRDVQVTPSNPVVPEEGKPVAVAVYVTDTLKTGAVGAFNLALASYLAASLGLLPAGAAQACIEDGALSPNLLENFHEVVNILVGLFNVDGAPHLRLQALHPPGYLPPADVGGLLRTYGSRVDLAVEIPGYGDGQLSFVVA
jgi:hypothetical protein